MKQFGARGVAGHQRRALGVRRRGESVIVLGATQALGRKEERCRRLGQGVQPLKAAQSVSRQSALPSWSSSRALLQSASLFSSAPEGARGSHDDPP